MARKHPIGAGRLHVDRHWPRAFATLFAMPEPTRAAAQPTGEASRPAAPARPHDARATSSATRACSRERTQVMRSSAMRDLMAITARPEVISLAGGLPDTSTFPPQSFAAQMTRIAHESSAEALQYGPTEGFEETKDCIVEVMGAEGMAPDPEDLIVTTGGQQAIDLIAKTLVDPGDPVICEAPDLPGRGADLLQLRGRRRSRSRPTRTACGSTSWRSCSAALAARGPPAEVHLLGAELPEPGRGDDVGASAGGAWSSWRASTRS